MIREAPLYPPLRVEYINPSSYSVAVPRAETSRSFRTRKLNTVRIPDISTDSFQRLRLFYQRNACAEVPNQLDSWVPGPEHLQIINVQSHPTEALSWCL